MTNNKDIRKHIKDSLKQDFKLDFVLIQIGFMFEAIEEDATFLCDNFDCQLQGEGKFVSYEITGFPVSGLENVLKDKHLIFLYKFNRRHKDFIRHSKTVSDS